MSAMRHAINFVLRWTERPLMARLPTPRSQRANLAFKSWLSFRAPRGSRFAPETLGGVPCLRVTLPTSRPDRVLLYLHGGAFAIGSPRTHRALAAAISARTGAMAILPDYRLAPENRFPAAPDDCLAAYKGLLAAGHDPGGIVIGGDSAGGGLAMTLLADILREDLPRPGAVFAFSPVVDLHFRAPSIAANAASDTVLPAEKCPEIRSIYLGDADPADPRASPVFADFQGAPPVAIWVGDTEILLDDARAMEGRLRDQGVETRLWIERDLPHVWPLFHNLLPEARRTLDQLAEWLSPRWPAQDGN